MLVDVHGRVHLSLSGRTARFHESVEPALAEALRARKPVLTDLHAGPGGFPPHIDVVAPIFAAGGKASFSFLNLSCSADS